METLKETKRTYTKSEERFILNFGVSGKDDMHAEFNYHQPTSSFTISINDAFWMEFIDEKKSIGSQDNVVNAHDEDSWCNYDFDKNKRYHIGCKTIPFEDKLKHSFDSFEFEFVVFE